MPKYDTPLRRRKSERNKQIIAFREAHPDYALREIAEAFNLTIQRVQQIIKANEKEATK